MAQEKKVAISQTSKRILFPHNKKLDKTPITTPFQNVVVKDDYYSAVDKETVLLFGSRDRQLSQHFISAHSPDPLIAAIIYKVVYNIAAFVAKKGIRVSFSTEDGASLATFDGKNITIGLGPLCDHRIPLHSRINVVIGTCIHEVLHVRHTTPEMGVLLMNKGMTKSALAKLSFRRINTPDFSRTDELFKHNFQKDLMNIVEDPRIENKGLESFPGYVFYMEEMRRYGCFNHINTLQDPAFKPDYNNPDEFWAALTRYLAFKKLGPEVLPLFVSKAPQSPEFKELMKKADAILDGTNVVTIEDSLAVSEKLLSLYPDDQKDKQASAQAKKKGGTGEEQMQQGTPMEGEGEGIPKDAKQELDQISAETSNTAKDEVKEVPSKMKHKNVHTDKYEKCAIVPMNENNFNDQVFKEAQSIAKQISKNLSFLDSRYNRTQETFELKSGELDDDELYSLGFNNAVFFEEDEAPGYSLDFGILVDESGSMSGHAGGSGSKIHNAKVAALGMALALQNSKHIHLYVYGHSANNHKDAPMTMYRYLDPQQKANNINSLFDIEARANNADGYAIGMMGEVLAKGKSKMKVMVVISDGHPHASGYDGEPAMSHTADIVRQLEKQNIYVVQVAMEHINSAKMFTNFIPYNNQSVGKNLKKVLMKKLQEISNLI